MALNFLTVIIFFNILKFSLCSNDIDNFGNELEITPSTFTGERYFGVYQVENTLNLTCILKNETDLENIMMDWTFPLGEAERSNITINHLGANSLNLVITNLTENDSGEYKCTALSVDRLWYSEKSIIINVKNKKGECSDMMFQCSCGMCIHKRYTCDGFKDCHHGEDELPSYCGPGNPCDNKLRCPDGRCIPYAWCCDLRREKNCTTKLKHDCCIHLEKLTHDIESDIGFQYKKHKFYDWSLLQTTVYVTIGCALAFTGMFIIIIIVIVVCRMQIRRSYESRCPAANARNVHGARNANENYVPFYDLDVYFNRNNPNDLMTANPLLVTYNIGSGVQFVGRPVEPPPYSEILRSPPKKEGPPPPYVSLENLAVPSQQNDEGKENAADPETETLLDSRNQISVISSNAIDIGERPSSVDGEHTRPDSKLAGGRSPQITVSKDQCPDRTNSNDNDSLGNEALVLDNDNAEPDSHESP